MDADRISADPTQRDRVTARIVSFVARNVGFICVAIVLVFCIISAFDPPRLNWGDSMSDYNAMNAGRNFARYGFLKLRLTPFLLDPAYMQPDDKTFVYTHYPQLPDLMNGVLRVAFGMTDIVQFRFVALLFSFASLFFIYRLLDRHWGRLAAQTALALWVVNPLWIRHADYLHHVPYGAFFGFGCLYLLHRYFDDERNWGFLAAAGVFAFLVVLASYDWWFFAPLLIAIATVANYRGVVLAPVFRVLGILAACCIAAVAFKVATNAWVLGGMRAFLNDLHFQYLERGTDTITRTTYTSGVWPTLYGRVDRFFTLLLFPIALFWALVPVLRRRSDPWIARAISAARVVPNPLLLLAAAVPFLYLFTEIWVGQYYASMLIVPFYAVAFGALIALLVGLGGAGRAVGVALFAAALLNSTVDNVRFKKAFFQRETIRTLAAQLDSVSSKGQLLLANHTFDGAYRYLFDRNSNALILIPPGVSNIALATYADPKQRPISGRPDGAIFVEHKHVVDELYDTGFYYILSRYRLWTLWGNPPAYHAAINEIIAERDSVLMSKVAAVGTKLYETKDYVIWRVKP